MRNSSKLVGVVARDASQPKKLHLFLKPTAGEISISTARPSF